MKDMMDSISKQNEEHVATAIGGKAPTASKPLPATLVNALGLRLREFVKHVSGRDFDIDQASGDSNQLPPKLYAMLVGAQAFIDSSVKKGLKPFEAYSLNAADIASDPDAVAGAIDTLSRAAKDNALWAAVRQPAEEAPGAPEEPEAAPEAPVATGKSAYEDMI